MKRLQTWVLVCLLGLAWVTGAEAQSRSGGTAAEPEAPGKAGSGTGVSPVEPTGGVSLPRLIKFSGLLKDRMGQPRTGIVGVTFALYQDQQGGAPLWLEVQNLELDDQGRYTVLLGATQTGGLPLELFAAGRARWLGIQVQGEEESPEASGRILLVSVPYALKAADAETLGGKPASAFVLAEDQAQSGGTGVPPVVSAATLSGTGPAKEQVTGTGTVNRIAKFTAADVVGNSLLFDNGVSIGLGTITPNAGGSFTIAGNGLVLSGGAQDLMVPDTQDLQMGHINALGTVFTERLRLTAGGSVGIGTPTPLAKLQVNVTNPFAGTVIGSSALSVGSVDIVTTDAQGANIGPLLALGGNRATTGTNLGVFGGIRGAKENSTDGNTAGYLGFYTLQAGVGFSERMRITSSGLVGMGTLSPNPGARLTLVGGLHMRGAVADVTVPDGENLQLGHLNFLGGLFTERMRITPTGDVGIGTAAPAEKLHVVGNVLASGSMSATSYVGSGAGLTSVNAATLNGQLASAFVLKAGDTMTGNLALPNLTASGSVTAATGSFSGNTTDQIVTITQSGSGSAIGAFSSGPVFSTIFARHTAITGASTAVFGLHDSDAGIGVQGRANATAGNTTGVRGLVFSPSGTGGIFINTAGGKILSGQVGAFPGTEVFSVAGNGNVLVSGSVTGASFAGSGAGLTSLDPASLSAGTAAIDISGNAATATTANNALALGGVPAASFARLDVGNSFNGDQTITGNLTATASITGATGSFSGTTAGGTAVLSATQSGAGGGSFAVATLGLLGQATTTGGGSTIGVKGTANSLVGAGVIGEATNTGALVSFGVLGITHSTTSGTGVLGQAAATTGGAFGVRGFVSSPDGVAGSFANIAGGKILSGLAGSAGTEVFRVDGSGTVSATSFAGSGAGLTGLDPASLSAGTAAISITGNAATATTANNALALGGVPAASFARLDIANSFTGDQSITGNLNVSLAVGAGSLSLPATTSASAGVITFGGSRFVHNFGAQNTFVGAGAGNFTMTGNSNTATGRSALASNTTGFENTASGSRALASNTTGVINTASGASALQANTTGGFNTASGVSALFSNTGGSENTASGTGALAFNTTGNNNTASGRLALFLNTTGNNNTASGFQAGVTANSLNANTTGSNNTFIGYNSGPGTATQLTNATALGANALVSASNALVLGDGTVNVGIGTTAPGQKLEVVGNVKLSGVGSSLIFPDATTQTTAAISPAAADTRYVLKAGDTMTGNLTLPNLTATGSITGASGSFSGSTGPNTGILSVAQSGEGAAVVGSTTSASVSNFALGVKGEATATSGAVQAVGVIGQANGPGGTLGVLGRASSTSGTGVQGEATATTGSGIGVLGKVSSAAGTAAVFDNAAAGKILSGRVLGVEKFSVDGSGNVRANAYLDLLGNPIAGTGDITGVTAGTGLSGGGLIGDVTLSLASAACPAGQALITLPASCAAFATLGANTFTGNQTITGSVSATGLVSLPATTSASAGVITFGGGRFVHNFGSGNTFVGAAAGNFTMTGFQNTASGANALSSNTTGFDNTASGESALRFNTTGSFNTASGESALRFNSTGSGNTASGFQAGHTANPANANTTGSNNTFIGFDSGPGTGVQLTNATAIGANAVVSASNALVLGASGVKVGIGVATPTNILTVVQTSATDPIADAWTVYSSRRWKTNIHPLAGALGKVERLRGVSFDWKADGKRDIGLIAEEVGEVVPEVVAYEDHSDNGDAKVAKSVDYARLTALLVEAVKEQQAQIRELKSEIAGLKAKLAPAHQPGDNTAK